ncbi:MAG TPA: TetR/AcrR family transcriptional regulator [Caulobacteraceae bacterium]|jgi:AcrR family transcriptional regulator|nr:TetR/AcrR family transcriptional regulator [Caulobacteraceae bacterium]
MTRPVRDSYRHGNVRAEATVAAYALVVAEGHEALSLRRVADAVGIAHRSLYNHFESREDLLDAVAVRGYAELAEAVKPTASREAFVAAYVGFALAQPHLYAVMNSRPHGTMPGKLALHRAAHLMIAGARRHFSRPEMSPAADRRATMKVLILLRGALTMYADGILDVPGDTGLVAELQAMVAAD